MFVETSISSVNKLSKLIVNTWGLNYYSVRGRAILSYVMYQCVKVVYVKIAIQYNMFISELTLRFSITSVFDSVHFII